VIGRDSSTGKGTDDFATSGGPISARSRGSSRGVGGSELSVVDVESSESCGPLDIGGLVGVGLGCSFRPSVPTCSGRPVVGVAGG